MAAMNTSIKYIPTSGSYTTSFGYSNTPQIMVGAGTITPADGDTPSGTPSGKNVPDKKVKVFIKPYTVITKYFSLSHYSFPLHQMPKENLVFSEYKSNTKHVIQPMSFMASAVRMDGMNAHFTVVGKFTPVVGNIIEIFDCGCTGKSVQDRYEFAEIVKFEEI